MATVTPIKETIITGYKCRCERCDHQWVSTRGTMPRICPKCKSAYWDVPRKTKEGGPKE